jgi:hypothetical protein
MKDLVLLKMRKGIGIVAEASLTGGVPDMPGI